MALVRGAGRRTNLALLALLAAAFATGVFAFAIGSAWVGWVAIAHGVTGLGILVLTPWKSTISARGLRRRPAGAWASIGLAAVVVLTIATGVGHSTGVLVSLGPATAMQVHVAAAVGSILLAGWHVLARKTVPRRTDVSRRNLLRGGVVLGGAAAGFAVVEGLVRATSLPGSDRRNTGSYERGSGRPDEMPVTQWSNDDVPTVDVDAWSLLVADARGERSFGYDELASDRRAVRATLDCTGGWFAEQEWEGISFADLLALDGHASSIEVTSVTGYARRLPVADAGNLLLATRVGGQPLSAGHGSPVRLVAPGRRGFWWVKWVERVALSDTPWWWQLPFPAA
ncbi:MAG TPA: molybdopterin-dependent oxidoreductase [Actinomycetota bacterium]|nr:molybdopterin-dependent oxidoreductase [Actinomycetota bacterium]